MFSRIKNIKEVVNWGLCVGCGACYSICDKNAVSLMNIEDVGIRPKFNSNCNECSKCLKICPGYSVDARELWNDANNHDNKNDLGPFVEIWEGFSTDEEIRHNASSGGIVSSLALYCVEREDYNYVLHTGANEKKPWLNKTCKSKTKNEILTKTGSRYAPASPCDHLFSIRNSKKKCIFIGKPCDVTAVYNMRKLDPNIDQNLGLVINIFCAGTPTTKGTLDMLQSLQIQKDDIDMIRYRGEGWPGGFKVSSKNNYKTSFIPYEKAWSTLTSYVPFRCRLCPDGLGRFADISCGDAWHTYENDKNKGTSIVIVRTEKGRYILHRAIQEGIVNLKPIFAKDVLKAQDNLLQKRKWLLGRLLAMKLFFIPFTKYRGFSLLKGWMTLSLWLKIRSIFGTILRIIKRKLWKKSIYIFKNTSN